MLLLGQNSLLCYELVVFSDLIIAPSQLQPYHRSLIKY